MNIQTKLSSRPGHRIDLTLAVLGAILSPTFGLADTPLSTSRKSPQQHGRCHHTGGI
jgi:hypothetical protein